MNTYTIGEVAARCGFPASTLRYYEGIGLVVPSERTDAGYRLYDERALARLVFVARAKQLGCSLEEIAELVAAWDGERCEPVQHRLHELVTAKIAEVRHQTGELVAFGAQLRAAAAQLATEPIDGPCDEGCACVANASAEPTLLGQRADSVPIACTLEGGLPAMEARISEWQAALAHASSRHITTAGTLRLEFDSDIPIGELAQLAAAEQACCRFLNFAITVDERGVGLEVRAPEGAEDLVASLFGGAA